MISKIPDAAIGAVVAALIAGTASLLGLIISKEQKISDFRQAWIDALRTDLSAFLTQINAITDAVRVKYDDHSAKVQTLRPLYMPLNTSTFNILLRVNPDEKRSARLVRAMEEFNKLTADESQLTPSNVRAVETEFLFASQLLLKAEWRRVKAGELTFKVAKVFAFAVIMASLIFGSVAAYRAWRPDESSQNAVTTKSSAPKNDHLETSTSNPSTSSAPKGRN